jgi:hypothetical protein
LEAYASDIRHCIKLNSEVKKDCQDPKNYLPKCKFEVADTVKGANTQSTHFFNYIVVVTGTFNNISVPAELPLEE